jgi:formate dehydrogenase iron-sulfur subunit
MEAAMSNPERNAAAPNGVIAGESELTAGVRIVPGRRYGLITDNTRSLLSKACELAC